jgi:hypothetical protein
MIPGKPGGVERDTPGPANLPGGAYQPAAERQRGK